MNRWLILPFGVPTVLALAMACGDSSSSDAGGSGGSAGGGSGGVAGGAVGGSSGTSTAGSGGSAGATVECPSAPPAGKYVDASKGNDQNDGSSTSPWRTLTRALEDLVPGDTLYLRGGTYFERDVEVALSGTAEKPITIRGYPCETAIIDAGWPDFRVAPNEDWEVANASLGEWRSKQAYTQSYKPNVVVGYVTGVSGYANERVGLVTYNTAENLRATSEVHAADENDASPLYVGPGVWRDDASGRIHVRLKNSAAKIPASDDPRNVPMYLSTAHSVLVVRQAHHLVIRDLVLQNALRALRIGGEATDLKVERVTTWGLNGVYISEPGNARITLTDSRLYSDFPDWVYWSDVKRPPDAASYLETTAFVVRADAQDIEVARVHARGGFDGMSVNEQATGVKFHHNLLESFRDDAFELDADDVDVHVHDNLVRDSFVGVAPSPSIVGPLYVYRNVIALFRQTRFRRPNMSLYGSTDELSIGRCFKFATCCGFGDPKNVKVYQNTLVHVGGVSRGIAHVNHMHPDAHVALNNIGWVANGEVAGEWGQPTLGQQIDGNLYFKANTADTQVAFRNIDGSADFETLAAFKASALFSASKASYAPGWEASGIEADPRFVAFTPVWDKTQPAWAPTAKDFVWPASAFELAPDSPARGAGLILPSALPDSHATPAGQKPDIGAIPFGAKLVVGPAQVPSGYERTLAVDVAARSLEAARCDRSDRARQDPSDHPEVVERGFRR